MNFNWFIYLFTFFQIKASERPPILSVYPKLSHYYYKTLKNKLSESLSIKFCRNPKIHELNFDIQRILPSQSVLDEWNTIKSLILYHGVSGSLCQSAQFQQYIKQFRGCFLPPSSMTSTIKATSHFHSDHPRCHNSLISSYCAPEGKIFKITPKEIAFQQYPFLINTTAPIITSRSGMLITKCNLIGLFNSCKAHSYSLYAALLDGPTSEGINATLCYPTTLSKPLHCPFPSRNILFIGSQYDDTQIGQFFLESLPRIVTHLDFLLSNSNVYIHYGFNSNNIFTSSIPHFLLSFHYFDFIGIDRRRLISGPVQVTQYALLPREGGCQDAAYNSWELHGMRQKLLEISLKKESTSLFQQWFTSTNEGRPFPNSSLSSSSLSSSSFSSSCNILFLYRTISKYSQNLFDSKRRFSREILNQLITLLQESNRTGQEICSGFHSNSSPLSSSSSSSLSSWKINIRIFSDDDDLLMKCLACQINLFSKANLVIGAHGAGLMNTIFLPIKSVVIELIPLNGMDSRHVPLNGIFSRLSTIFGLYHYLYLDDLNSHMFPHRLVENIFEFFHNLQFFSTSKS